MGLKRPNPTDQENQVFGQGIKASEIGVRVVLYARVSTPDQQVTLPMLLSSSNSL